MFGLKSQLRHIVESGQGVTEGEVHSTTLVIGGFQELKQSRAMVLQKRGVQTRGAIGQVLMSIRTFSVETWSVRSKEATRLGAPGRTTRSKLRAPGLTTSNKKP